MLDKERIERLDRWHEENRHREILKEIEALPEQEQADYELQGRRARALNNLGRFREAIEVLEAWRQQGEADSRWWSRLGYALYHLDRLGEARDCFLSAQRLDPENGDARTFLAWLNVSPSGKANAWDGAAAGKESTGPGAVNGGWSGGAEASRGRPKPETANGWAEDKKGSAGKRSKGDGGISSWEGRGWEGTAQLDTRLFGSLRFPVKEGLFETMAVTVDGEKLVTDLFIREDLALPERWEALTALLDSVPAMYRAARERMNADYEENEVIRFFVRDQLAELEEAPLLAALGVKSREEATPERFVRALRLKGIAVAPRPGGSGEPGCTLDFCLDPEITDELLVFRFTRELELYDISHES